MPSSASVTVTSDRHADRAQRDGAVDLVRRTASRTRRGVHVNGSTLPVNASFSQKALSSRISERAQVGDAPASRAGRPAAAPSCDPRPRVEPGGQTRRRTPRARAAGLRVGRAESAGSCGIASAGEAKGSPAAGSPSSTRSSATWLSAPRSVGPGLDPVVLGPCRSSRVVVGAVRLRGGPVLDLVEVRLVGRVDQLAVAGRDASRPRRRPAWLVGASPNQTVACAFGLGRHHVVHPQVHAVRMGRVLARSSRCPTSRSSPRRAGSPSIGWHSAWSQVDLVLPASCRRRRRRPRTR